MPFGNIKQIFGSLKSVNLLKPYSNLPRFATLTLLWFALAYVFIQAKNRIFLFVAHLLFIPFYYSSLCSSSKGLSLEEPLFYATSAMNGNAIIN